MADEKNKTTERIDIPVTGMNCAGCAANIEKALKNVAGVESAAVNFATARATVLYSPRLVSRNELEAAIVDAGYGVLKSRPAKRRRTPSAPSGNENIRD